MNHYGEEDILPQREVPHAHPRARLRTAATVG